MKFMNEWWGVNENISPLEIAARSAVMFLIALLLMRMAGMRPFGKGEPFDNIITFLIGGILSRGVVGATPFFSGAFMKENMNRGNITEHDIMEDLRLEVQLGSLKKIWEVYMERTGEISFVKKDDE